MSAAISSILVRAPNWLGDVIMALPAIGAIRVSFPTVPLTVAARAGLAPLFAHVPAVDDVVALAGRGGASELGAWQRNVAALGAAHHDAAILFPNSLIAALQVHRAGIPERWGYATDARRLLLTRAVPKPKAIRIHQVDYYLELVRALGVEGISASTLADDDVHRSPPSPVIAVSDSVKQAANALLALHGVPAEAILIGVAPGAAYGQAKRWLPQRFADVIGRLHSGSQCRCVLVGSEADRPTADAIIQELARHGQTTPNLAGRTDLTTLLGIVQRCRAFVSNDSGAMHLAAALGVPVTAIFGPTDEHATGPRWGNHRVLTHAVWCRPCLLRECPIDHRCMTGITSQDVFGAVLESMKE
jgi:heptosyltransferase-2